MLCYLRSPWLTTWGVCRNAGMVMHILKGNPALRDLKHVQVDGPGTAYLFFFNKQGHKGLTLDATQTLRTNMGEAFAEWISCSVHFAVILLPLAEGQCQAVATSECKVVSHSTHKAVVLLPLVVILSLSHPQTHCCRRRWQSEKRLTPAHLDMLIFKLTD